MTPRPPVEPLYYTPEEAAVVLGVSRDQVYKLLASGALAAARVGRLRRIPRKQLSPEMLVDLQAAKPRRAPRRTEATT